MNDEMTDCANPKLPDEMESNDQKSTHAGVVSQLPTLQRNALRKIFDRQEFTPEDVAALGYRRLQQAEGIGHKGLAVIGAWLSRHGYELRAPDPLGPVPTIRNRRQRSIEVAVRLLRTHGYVVMDGGNVPGDGGTSTT